MIRSIKYDSIRKIIVLSCNFLPFSSFLLKHILNNANVMNVLCFYKKKKKRLRENTIIGKNYDLECNGDVTSWSRALFVLRPFCSAPFLLCALFALRPYCPRPFCCAQMSCFAKCPLQTSKKQPYHQLGALTNRAFFATMYNITVKPIYKTPKNNCQLLMSTAHAIQLL